MRLWRTQLALAASGAFFGRLITTVETVRPTSSEPASSEEDDFEHAHHNSQEVASSEEDSFEHAHNNSQEVSPPADAKSSPQETPSWWGPWASSLGFSGNSSSSNKSAQVNNTGAQTFESGEHPKEEGALQSKARNDLPPNFPLEVSHTANGAVMNFPNGTKDIKVQDIRLDPGTPGDFKNNLLGLDAELGAHQVGTIPDAMMTYHTNALRAEKGTDYWYDQAKWVRERGANDWRDALLHTLYRIDAEERLVAKTIGNDYRAQPESAENDPTAIREPRRYKRKDISPSKWQQETQQWKLDSGGGLDDGSWSKWLFG